MNKRSQFSCVQRGLALLTSVSVFFVNVLMVAFSGLASAEASFENVNHLPGDEDSFVLLVVDEKSWKNSSVKNSIERYGDDIRSHMSGTNTGVLLVDENANVNLIANNIESIYRSSEYGKMIGTVLIGNIPVPKTVSGEQTFFPYVDFDEKVFVYDAKEDGCTDLEECYKEDRETTDRRAEIWFGVIRPPAKVNSSEWNDMLVSYFDKNHLVYSGESKFNQEIFYSNDKVRNDFEAEMFLEMYEGFLDHQEDYTFDRVGLLKLLKDPTAKNDFDTSYFGMFSSSAGEVKDKSCNDDSRSCKAAQCNALLDSCENGQKVSEYENACKELIHYCLNDHNGTTNKGIWDLGRLYNTVYGIYSSFFGDPLVDGFSNNNKNLEEAASLNYEVPTMFSDYSVVPLYEKDRDVFLNKAINNSKHIAKKNKIRNYFSAHKKYTGDIGAVATKTHRYDKENMESLVRLVAVADTKSRLVMKKSFESLHDFVLNDSYIDYMFADSGDEVVDVGGVKKYSGQYSRDFTLVNNMYSSSAVSGDRFSGVVKDVGADYKVFRASEATAVSNTPSSLSNKNSSAAVSVMKISGYGFDSKNSSISGVGTDGISSTKFSYTNSVPYEVSVSGKNTTASTSKKYSIPAAKKIHSNSSVSAGYARTEKFPRVIAVNSEDGLSGVNEHARVCGDLSKNTITNSNTRGGGLGTSYKKDGCLIDSFDTGNPSYRNYPGVDFSNYEPWNVSGLKSFNSEDFVSWIDAPVNYVRSYVQAYAHMPMKNSEGYKNSRDRYLKVPSPFVVSDLNEYKENVGDLFSQLSEMKKAKEYVLDESFEDKSWSDYLAKKDGIDWSNYNSLIDESELEKAIVWNNFSLEEKLELALSDFWFGSFDEEASNVMMSEVSLNETVYGTNQLKRMFDSKNRNYEIGVLISDGDESSMEMNFSEIDHSLECEKFDYAGFCESQKKDFSIVVDSEKVIEKIKPSILFTILGGGVYGNVENENYLGGSWLFNEGKSISALATMKGGKILDVPTNRDTRYLLDVAAGNSIGESIYSHMNYGDVILGDPVISLEVKDNLSVEKYRRGNGFFIGRAERAIVDMASLDIDLDGDADIIYYDEDDEKVKWYENVGKGKKFYDRGVLVFVPEGIADLRVLDVDEDGEDDFAVISKNPSNVILYINDDMNLTKSVLEGVEADAVVSITYSDRDGDGKKDLVVFDSQGVMNVFVKTPRGFVLQPGFEDKTHGNYLEVSRSRETYITPTFEKYYAASFIYDILDVEEVDDTRTISPEDYDIDDIDDLANMDVSHMAKDENKGVDIDVRIDVFDQDGVGANGVFELLIIYSELAEQLRYEKNINVVNGSVVITLPYNMLEEMMAINIAHKGVSLPLLKGEMDLVVSDSFESFVDGDMEEFMKLPCTVSSGERLHMKASVLRSFMNVPSNEVKVVINDGVCEADISGNREIKDIAFARAVDTKVRFEPVISYDVSSGLDFNAAASEDPEYLVKVFAEPVDEGLVVGDEVIIYAKSLEGDLLDTYVSSFDGERAEFMIPQKHLFNKAYLYDYLLRDGKPMKIADDEYTSFVNRIIYDGARVLVKGKDIPDGVRVGVNIQVGAEIGSFDFDDDGNNYIDPRFFVKVLDKGTPVDFPINISVYSGDVKIISEDVDNGLMSYKYGDVGVLTEDISVVVKDEDGKIISSDFDVSTKLFANVEGEVVMKGGEASIIFDRKLFSESYLIDLEVMEKRGYKPSLIQVEDSAILSGTVKTMKDLNGGFIDLGDIVQVDLDLKNLSNYNASGAVLVDDIPSFLEYIEMDESGFGYVDGGYVDLLLDNHLKELLGLNDGGYKNFEDRVVDVDDIYIATEESHFDLDLNVVKVMDLIPEDGIDPQATPDGNVRIILGEEGSGDYVVAMIYKDGSVIASEGYGVRNEDDIVVLFDKSRVDLFKIDIPKVMRSYSIPEIKGVDTSSLQVLLGDGSVRMKVDENVYEDGDKIYIGDYKFKGMRDSEEFRYTPNSMFEVNVLNFGIEDNEDRHLRYYTKVVEVPKVDIDICKSNSDNYSDGGSSDNDSSGYNNFSDYSGSDEEVCDADAGNASASAGGICPLGGNSMMPPINFCATMCFPIVPISPYPQMCIQPCLGGATVAICPMTPTGMPAWLGGNCLVGAVPVPSSGPDGGGGSGVDECSSILPAGAGSSSGGSRGIGNGELGVNKFMKQFDGFPFIATWISNQRDAFEGMLKIPSINVRYPNMSDINFDFAKELKANNAGVNNEDVRENLTDVMLTLDNLSFVEVVEEVVEVPYPKFDKRQLINFKKSFNTDGYKNQFDDLKEKFKKFPEDLKSQFGDVNEILEKKKDECSGMISEKQNSINSGINSIKSSVNDSKKNMQTSLNNIKASSEVFDTLKGELEKRKSQLSEASSGSIKEKGEVYARRQAELAMKEAFEEIEKVISFSDLVKNKLKEGVRENMDILDSNLKYVDEISAMAKDGSFINDKEFLDSIDGVLESFDKLIEIKPKLQKIIGIKSKILKEVKKVTDTIKNLLKDVFEVIKEGIGKWIDAILSLISVLKVVDTIIDLIKNYKLKCDDCRNYKKGMFSMMLPQMPSPPVLRPPPIPDFELDLRKIIPSVKLTVPSFKITPVELEIPPIDLPSFDLDPSSLIPDVEAMLEPLSCSAFEELFSVVDQIPFDQIASLLSSFPEIDKMEIGEIELFQRDLDDIVGKLDILDLSKYESMLAIFEKRIPEIPKVLPIELPVIELSIPDIEIPDIEIPTIPIPPIPEFPEAPELGIDAAGIISSVKGVLNLLTKIFCMFTFGLKIVDQGPNLIKESEILTMPTGKGLSLNLALPVNLDFDTDFSDMNFSQIITPEVGLDIDINIAEPIKAVAEEIKETVKGVTDQISDLGDSLKFENPIDIQGMFDSIVPDVESVITGALSDSVNILKSALGKSTSGISDSLNGLGDSIEDIDKNLDGLGDSFNGSVDELESSAEKKKDSFSGLPYVKSPMSLLPVDNEFNFLNIANAAQGCTTEDTKIAIATAQRGVWVDHGVGDVDMDGDLDFIYSRGDDFYWKEKVQLSDFNSFDSGDDLGVIDFDSSLHLSSLRHFSVDGVYSELVELSFSSGSDVDNLIDDSAYPEILIEPGIMKNLDERISVYSKNDLISFEKIDKTWIFKERGGVKIYYDGELLGVIKKDGSVRYDSFDFVKGVSKMSYGRVITNFSFEGDDVVKVSYPRGDVFGYAGALLNIYTQDDEYIETRDLRVFDDNFEAWVDKGRYVDVEINKDGSWIKSEFGQKYGKEDLLRILGDVKLSYSDGSFVNLSAGQMLGFSNHTSGYYDLEIDNGKYYLEVVPVQFSGELGVKSRKLYVNPNVSYDIDAPNVYMSPGEMVGYFGEAIELSAESDEDDVEFVWDLNLGIDSDGDGVFDNDSDSFEKVVSVELLSSDGQGVSLRGRDEAGNYSDISTIFADISAPDLVLFDSKIKDGVSGVAYPGARVGLFRKRGGANPSMISTVEADDGGEFSFDDLNYGTNGVKLYSSSKSKAVFDISSGGVMNSLDSGLTISSVEDDEWLRFVLEASGADVLDVKMRFDMGNVKIYDNDVVYEGSDEGIYLMKSPDINVEPVNGGLSVLKKGDFLFEIVNNGKIRLGKSKILDVSADGVEFGLGGESVAVFKWNLRDSISISTASAGSMDSSDANDGVYLEDLNSRDDYSLVYDSDIVSGDEVFVGVMSKEGIIVSRTSSKFY